MIGTSLILAVLTPGYAWFLSADLHSDQPESKCAGVLCDRQISRKDASVLEQQLTNRSPCNCLQTLTTESTHNAWHGPSSSSSVDCTPLLKPSFLYLPCFYSALPQLRLYSRSFYLYQSHVFSLPSCRGFPESSINCNTMNYGTLKDLLMSSKFRCESTGKKFVTFQNWLPNNPKHTYKQPLA